MACSLRTLSPEISRFDAFPSEVRGFFFVFFRGKTELAWILFTPVYPVSNFADVPGWMCVLDSLNTLKSWRFPFEKAVQITSRVLFSTVTWVFSVCRFFLPE